MSACCLRKQLERRLVLVLVQLVGVLDAELGLLGHQIERGVGDVDRRRRRPGRGPCCDLPSGSVCSSNTTLQLFGASLKTLVLYMSTFGPHW